MAIKQSQSLSRSHNSRRSKLLRASVARPGRAKLQAASCIHGVSVATDVSSVLLPAVTLARSPLRLAGCCCWLLLLLVVLHVRGPVFAFYAFGEVQIKRICDCVQIGNFQFKHIQAAANR